VLIATVTTVEMSTNDISNECCYCAFASLVPPHSSKLELRYLKTEAYKVVLNIVTRPRVCGSGRGGLGRQCARPDSDHEGGCEGSARMRVAVLRPTVTGADGGGGLRWPEPMVVVAFMHVGGAPPMSVLG
jgi:hypothetical protein